MELGVGEEMGGEEGRGESLGKKRIGQRLREVTKGQEEEERGSQGSGRGGKVVRDEGRWLETRGVMKVGEPGVEVEVG